MSDIDLLGARRRDERPPRRLPWRTSIVAITMAALLAACGGSVDQASTEPDAEESVEDGPTATEADGTDTEEGTAAAPERTCEGEEVSLGTSGGASDAPIFIAEAMGYFADAGLSVNYNEFASSSDMIAPLATGDLDAAGTATTAAFYNAIAGDISIKVVADKSNLGSPGEAYAGIIVRQDLLDSGEVSEIADLEGLTIADYAEASTTSAGIEAILQSAGLSLDDVNRVYLGGSERIQALENGQIDASYSPEFVITQAEDLGVASLFAAAGDYLEGQQLSNLQFSESFIETRRDVAACFLTAWVRAERTYADALADDGTLTGPGSDEVVPVIADQVGVEEELIRRATAPAVNPDGYVNVEAMQDDLDFFRRMGVLDSEDIMAEDVVDHSLLDEVHEILGAYEPRTE